MGEKWRECRFHPRPTLSRLCVLAMRPEEWRACIEDRCPVPALVEAVEVARTHCGWLLSEYQDAEMQGKPADVVEASRCVYDKCQAALAAAKGG